VTCALYEKSLGDAGDGSAPVALMPPPTMREHFERLRAA
jgi:hypothetical protein